jgi:hypothetical protein
MATCGGQRRPAHTREPAWTVGLQRWQRAERRTLRWARAAGVLLALSLIALIPVLGPLIGFLVMSAGLGALLKQVRRPQAAA